jgi:hypothetical protein
MQKSILSAYLVAGALTLAGCGSSHVEPTGPGVAARGTRPDRIVVEDFTVEPNAVALDSGIGPRLARAVGSGNTASAQGDTANKVVHKLSDTLVEQLNTTGIATSPGRTQPALAPGYTTLIVSGKIVSINEGNRTRRNVVGLGVGASKVTAEVDVYLQASGAAPRLMQSFNADSESGKKPGLAVAGVGAAAGHAATAAAVGVGSSVASEKLGATVEDDAARMGKQIAETLKTTLFTDQGWVVPSR